MIEEGIPPATDWDFLAEWWRETFTNGADVEYEAQIIPLVAAHLDGRRHVLDVGTGEGQIARSAAASGASPFVVGADPSTRQLVNATGSGGGPAYVRARGEDLPFASASFDALVCCLVIEHADDQDAVLREMVRVLEPDGILLLLVNHPITQGAGSGFVDDVIMGEHYWRIGPYLEARVVIEEVDPGVPVRFTHRPLSGYINALCEEGLVLTRLEEPAPPLEFLVDSTDLALERAMPRLCLMRFSRPSGPGARMG